MTQTTEHVRVLGSANGVQSPEYAAAERLARLGGRAETYDPTSPLAEPYRDEPGHGHLGRGILVAIALVALVVAVAL